MRCGELPQGFLGKNGKPCRQVVAADETRGCVWHRADAAGRTAFAKMGVLGRERKKALPGLKIGNLSTDEGIASTLQELCERAASEQVDLRRVAEIRQSLNVAVSLRQTHATRELNRTLLRLEHGQKAVVLLEQLRGERVMKPLPGVKKQEPIKPPAISTPVDSSTSEPEGSA